MCCCPQNQSSVVYYKHDKHYYMYYNTTLCRYSSGSLGTHTCTCLTLYMTVLKLLHIPFVQTCCCKHQSSVTGTAIIVHDQTSRHQTESRGVIIPPFSGSRIGYMKHVHTFDGSCFLFSYMNYMHGATISPPDGKLKSFSAMSTDQTNIFRRRLGSRLPTR